jgi:hypothetical protein
MEDGAPFSPEIYFGHPVNFIQYVRRLGDPFGVLWRLPTYYEPSPQIGLVMNPDELRDKVAFKDKIPRVVWRGAATGEYWDNPFSFRKLTVLWSGPDPVEPLDYWSERYAAVQKSLMHPELFDCRFVIRRKARKRLGLKPNLEGFQHPGFSRERTREWMLRFKYQLCLPGNDVSTQLYWVIATNSIAFKTQCEFDSLADFFLRPWVHYVPIARDLHDLADKLAFCEANPDFCLALIERANQAYADMLNPTLWDAAEKTVLDRLGWLSA